MQRCRITATVAGSAGTTSGSTRRLHGSSISASLNRVDEDFTGNAFRERQQKLPLCVDCDAIRCTAVAGAVIRQLPVDCPIGIFDDGGTTRMVYHYYDAEVAGEIKFDVKTISWSQDGWPSLK